MKFTFTNNHLEAASQNGKGSEMKSRVKLTKREKEILELVAQGLSAQEIATLVFVSLNTVETHRRNIMQKLGARNTVEAVARAIRTGVIK